MPYNPFVLFCKVSSNVLSFILDFSNLNVSPFFLVRLAKNLSVCWSFKEPTFNFVGFLYGFSVISFIYLCSNLYYDLSWRMFPVHLRRMCILLLLDGVLHRCLLGLVGLNCCSTVPLLVFWLIVLPILKVSIEISSCYCWSVYFSFQLYQFLLHVYLGSVIRCIYVYFTFILFLMLFLSLCRFEFLICHFIPSKELLLIFLERQVYW